jgi:cation transport ATPase
MCTLLFSIVKSNAQFKSATIGIDGLTCSACSYGTEQSIRKLQFVSDVKTDLNTTTAVVSFSPSSSVSMNEVVRKVAQAGFSVRFTKAIYHFEKREIAAGDTIMIGNEVFYILDTKSKTADGDVEIQFIGEHFSPKKNTQSWQNKIRMAKLKYPLLKPDTYYIIL